MPYILPKDRDALDPVVPDTRLPAAATSGELNFQITKLVDRYIKYQGGNYEAINAAIGVLECAKLEAYRRIAAPYEDTKLIMNGDVYS
jgi:hypothetical protein